MKPLLKTALVVTIFAFSAFSLAQAGGGGGRGQRGGFGGGANQPEVFLIRRADVQSDLNISADTKASIDKIFQEAGMGGGGRGQGGGAGRGNGGGFGGGGAAGGAGAGAGAGGGQAQMTQEQRAERQKQMQERMKAIEEKLKAVLSADNLKRIHQISVQLAKNRAILRDDVATELGLSADVKAKAKSLQENAQKANQEVQLKMRNQEIERADGQAIVEKNTTTLEEELGKLLTSAQAAQLKAMGGSEFKAQPQGQGRRGGGGN